MTALLRKGNFIKKAIIAVIVVISVACFYRISTNGELVTFFEHYEIFDKHEFSKTRASVGGVDIEISLGVDCTDEYTSIPYLYTKNTLKFPYELTVFIQGNKPFMLSNANFTITHHDGTEEVSEWAFAKFADNPSKSFSNAKPPPLTLEDSKSLDFKLSLQCGINGEAIKLRLFPHLAHTHHENATR